MNNLISVQNQEGQLVVTSRQVAEHFDKRHADVLDKIDFLLSQINSTEKSVQYFIPSEYKDTSGKTNKEHLLTRDGFTLLAMGFTGTKALEWKLKYIEAFNRMEKQLQAHAVNRLENVANDLRSQFKLLQDEIETKVSAMAEQANENHRPSHRTKLNWNNIIKHYAVCKGDEEMLKQATLDQFNASKWEDVPYSKKSEVLQYIRTLAQELKMFIQESLY